MTMDNHSRRKEQISISNPFLFPAVLLFPQGDPEIRRCEDSKPGFNDAPVRGHGLQPGSGEPHHGLKQVGGGQVTGFGSVIH